MTTTIVRGQRVLLPDGLRPATLVVRAGRIVEVIPGSQPVSGMAEIDAGEAVMMPGIVDTHVHVNEPGRTDWEGFEHATRAAAAGGVTTIVDMPLNSVPPTTNVASLEEKRRAAEGRCHVDVAFWGGVVPGNSGELESLARAGVAGFKCFLCPSGVDEFAPVDERDLRQAMPVLARVGLPLLAHAELPSRLRAPAGNPRRYSTWLESRPAESEHAAIDLLVGLAREFNARVHIVHLASADAVPMLAAACKAGVNVTVETCPHYLTFSADDIPDGATAFKCAPPIRQNRHCEGLWAALKAGAIDFVATDHSPAPPSLKHVDTGDFVAAWGGIASLQLGLAVVWTGADSRTVPLGSLARWLCEAPARLAGLDRRKGQLTPGHDADVVIWDPEAEFTVDASALYHRHALTPYAGRQLRGRVRLTILRGEVIFADGECRGAPKGQLLQRSPVQNRRHDPNHQP